MKKTPKPIVFLGIFLILLSLIQIIALVFIIQMLGQEDIEEIKEEIKKALYYEFFLYIVAQFSYFVGAIGIIIGKRWGRNLVLLYIISSVIGTIIELLNPTETLFSQVVANLIFFPILFIFYFIIFYILFLSNSSEHFKKSLPFDIKTN